MKYSYYIKEFEVNGSNKMYFSLEEKFLPISRFINTDVGEEYGAQFYINRIRKVLNGEVLSDRISGNSTILTIMPDIVKIEEKFFHQQVVSLETNELIQLIEAFILEKKKYEDKMEN